MSYRYKVYKVKQSEVRRSEVIRDRRFSSVYIFICIVLELQHIEAAAGTRGSRLVILVSRQNTALPCSRTCKAYEAEAH